MTLRKDNCLDLVVSSSATDHYYDSFVIATKKKTLSLSSDRDWCASRMT